MGEIKLGTEVRVTEPTDSEWYGAPRVGDIWAVGGIDICYVVDGPFVLGIEELKALNARLAHRRGADFG